MKSVPVRLSFVARRLGMICVSLWKHVFCMCILPFSGSHGDRSTAINISYLSHSSRYSRCAAEYFMVCVTAELVFSFRIRIKNVVF